MTSRRRVVPALATAAAVVGAVGVVVWQLDPNLLLRNTLTTGGDTGAHVATVAFLRTTLLPHLHVTGWDPGWYDGFPVYTFYFPLPDVLAAVGGDIVAPDVAFKLMTALGPCLMPAAAWLFGRLAGLQRPRPAVLAVATLPFVFDQTFTIDGGNIYSTMAGEYAYTIALALALVFVGCCFRGMRTGRGRAVSAAVLAAAALSHLVPTMFAVAGAVLVLAVSRPTLRRLWWMVTVGALAAALAAFWALPFVSDLAYSTNMGWTKVRTYAALLAPGSGLFHGDRWVLWLAGAGVVVGCLQRRRPVVVLAVLGALSAFAVTVASPTAVYNARFVPLWLLCAYLVAGTFVAEVLVALVATGRALWGRSRAGTGRSGDQTKGAPGAVVGPLVALAAGVAVVLPPLVPSVGADLHVAQSSVPSWVSWDYSGYQAKSGWPELKGVVGTVGRVVRANGCGRVMWEYSPQLDRFGTPMALMDLPMWTGGCATTQEGLLFESSATTPYHFIDQAELSADPSEAMAGLPYPRTVPDVAAGVAHLQLMGVRYFLASSPSVEAAAAADPALRLLATSGPWRTPYDGRVLVTTWELFEVHGASTVVPLGRTPRVLRGVGPGQPSWLPTALRWYDHPSDWSTELVAGGPPQWPRVTARRAFTSLSTAARPAPATAVPAPAVPAPAPAAGRPVTATAVDRVAAARATTDPGAAGGRPVPPRQSADSVSGIRMGTDSVRFTVSRPGVPVLVKVSYFPNWHAVGAQGPWRAEPNLMVVVPTAHHVTLVYGSTGPAVAGQLLTGLGVAGLLVVAVGERPRRRTARRRSAGAGGHAASGAVQGDRQGIG